MLVLVITTFDDKREYDHVFLHPSSYTFLGLEWEGRYLSTLPFGVEDKRLHLSFNRFGSDFLYPFLGCTMLTIYWW